MFALIVVPLAALARHNLHLTRAIWAAAILLFLASSLCLCIRLVYGKPLVLRHRRGAISVASAAAIVPTLFALRAILPNFRMLQINSLLLLLVLVGCYLIVRSRPVSGGALIGAAAAIKVLPIFFVPYFIWKRWWRALGAMLLGGAALTVLPIVVFGFERWWSYASRFLGRSTTSTFVFTGSQSLYSMLHRLIVLRTWWHPESVFYQGVMDTRVMIAALLVLLVLRWGFKAVRKDFGKTRITGLKRTSKSLRFANGVRSLACRLFCR